MTSIANGEQMTALGLAMHAHRLTREEAVELWVTATAGVNRTLTADEAIELTARVDAMPIIPTVLRGPACHASWPRRCVRRHRRAR